MKTPPEAYLIFKEELRKAEIAKQLLKLEYEDKFKNMNQEFAYLKEQISSQQQMMKTTIDYAIRLEEELNSLRQQIQEDKKKLKRSHH